MSVLAGAVLASTVSSVGYVIVVLTLIAFGVAVFINIRRARAETGSELELAPNRVPHHPDEILEGPVLNRNLAFGLGAIVIISIGLPVYWLGEPARNEGAQATFDRVAAERGAEQFAVTAEGGLNCAGCHGGMDAPGGVAPYTINDANGEFVASVEWQAPALNTVLLRFDEEELYDILVYGRPFSPMPAWGIEGGGALNDQQIGNLIAYLKTIQITPEEAQAAATDALADAMASGQYETEGEALFNLGLYDGFAGGAYSCGRCHTQGWSYGEPESDGDGALGPNLTAVRSQFPGGAAGFQEQVDFVTEGSVKGVLYGVHGQGTGRMPGFDDMLTDEQIQAIVEYERNLGDD
ncbi:MAG: c-type cytochrome [Acidimicrobiales bacterium]